MLAGWLFVAPAKGDELNGTELSAGAGPGSGLLQGKVESPGQKWFGMIDLRPSWLHGKGTWDTENTAQLGYAVNEKLKLDYVQYFNSSLYNPAGAPGGVGLYADVGFARLKVDKIWEDKKSNTYLNYAVRLYTPTNPYLRIEGMLTQVRNYFALKHKVSHFLTISLDEVPMLDVYAQPGTAAAGPNPIFENGIFLIGEFTLLNDKLTLSVPLMLSSIRYRNYISGVAYNDRWAHTVWTWPEIDFTIAPHAEIGMSWYSGNFIKDDFSGFALAEGIAQGTLQFVLRGSI